MPSVTIYFANPYSLVAGFSTKPGLPKAISPELQPHLTNLFAIAGVRLKELAKSEQAYSKTVEGETSITLSVEKAGEGPVNISWKNLGCPRDQMIMLSEQFRGNFLVAWFKMLQASPMPQNAGKEIILPKGLDFSNLHFGNG